jgi:hypothetical protein
MIYFEPVISWTWAWIFAAALVVILCIQVFWISKSSLSSGRKVLRSVLNVLLVLVLIAYVFQPDWKSSKPEQAVLLISSNMERDQLNFWKDSLDVKKVIEISKYQGQGNPVYLLGSDFSRIELLKIGKKDIRWIQNTEPRSMSFLEWKAILSQGERQVIKGRMVSNDSLKISLSQQAEVVAETMILPHSGIFSLEFPVSVLGRNSMDLMVNDSLYGQINFFATAKKPIQYRMRFAFPDPEIRFLSQYLINSGEPVSEEIAISKSSSIRSGRYDSDSLQFLIIDPAQLTLESTRMAMEEGASVLVINLNSVEKDISAVNTAFETSFRVKQNSSENNRTLADDLEALPFEFEPTIAQQSLFEGALAVQQIGNAKVGVSLLGKTFPIKLAGDSLQYQAIWQQILGAMQPQDLGAVQLTQPVFKDMQTEITLNQKEFSEDFLRVESDSVYLQQSLVNPFSKSGSFISLGSGWITMGDSLEFYSYGATDWPSLATAKMRADFLKEQSREPIVSANLGVEKKISDWVWLSLFLVILTLVWVEPKVMR